MFKFLGKGSRGGLQKEAHRRQPRLMQGQDAYTFRRSRTLTGSAANTVVTPKAARPDLKSERLQQHELRRRRRLLHVSLLALAGLLAVTALLLQNNFAFGRLAFATGAQVPAADQQALRSSVNAYINQHPTEAFFATLNTSRLTQFLQKNHAEVQNVVAISPLLGTGTLKVTFRQPMVSWQTGGERFFVDASGTAFRRHYGAEPALKLEDTSGYTPEGNGAQSVASRRFIGYLGQLLGAVQDQAVGTVERVVIPASTRQLDIYLQGRAYPIKTHIDRDPYAQVEDLKHALVFLDEKAVAPQYVDVRVEGKAFYR